MGKENNIQNGESNVKQVQHVLLAQFLIYIALALLIVLLFEADIILPGIIASDQTMQYVLLMLMELLTIACIPLALKFFSMKSVKKRLVAGRNSTLLLFGTLRLAMLGAPVVVNALLYYLSLSATFGYLAILGALCLAFVYPSESRCLNEIAPEE